MIFLPAFIAFQFENSLYRTMFVKVKHFHDDSIFEIMALMHLAGFEFVKAMSLLKTLGEVSV